MNKLIKIHWANDTYLVLTPVPKYSWVAKRTQKYLKQKKKN
jgi:hypothetical protein